jgi:hypothetical protein
MRRRTTHWAAALTLTAGLLAAAAWVAGGAQATTGTCLGTQNPVSGPVSCGGLFLPAKGSGIQPNTTSLTLTAASDFWNAPLTFALYSPSRSDQDFTVYERCNGGPGPARSETNPCGTGFSAVLNAASGQPEFVAEVTPLGHHVGGGINTIGNLCISEQGVHDGPLVHGHHALRWHMVERTCDTSGAVFTAGITDGLNAPPNNTGVPGVVVSPNPWQTFAAVPANGGDVIANDLLSGNFLNTLFVVDDRAGAYPSGQAIVYPENDGGNQIAKFVGCNGAVLTTGVSFTCP